MPFSVREKFCGAAFRKTVALRPEVSVADAAGGRTTFRRVIAQVGIGVVVYASVLTLGAGTAAAEPSFVPSSHTIGPVTVNCGIVTCSAYLSRSATRSVYDSIDGIDDPNIDAPAGACEQLAEETEAAAPITLAVCVADATWALEEIKRAVEDHGERGACLKVTWTQTNPPVITYWSTNNGQYCHD